MGNEPLVLNDVEKPAWAEALDSWAQNHDAVLRLTGASVGQAEIDCILDAGALDRVDFRGTRFVGPVDFRGAHWAANATDFEGSTWDAVSFAQCKFASKTLNFKNARFMGAVSFDDANFGSCIATISGSFNAKASFEGTVFGDDVFFAGAEFTHPVSFRGATFSKVSTRFDSCQFEGGVDVSDLHLPDLSLTTFVNCDFPGSPDILGGSRGKTVATVPTGGGLVDLDYNRPDDALDAFFSVPTIPAVESRSFDADERAEPTRALTISSTDAHERLDRLESFIEQWCGPRKPEYGGTASEAALASWPLALGRLYRFSCNWPSPGRPGPFALFRSQDHLCAPEEWQTLSNGLTVFAFENQGLCRWATDMALADGPVYQDGDDIDSRSDDSPISGWGQRADTLSEFLTGYCVAEIFSASQVGRQSGLSAWAQLNVGHFEPLAEHIYGQTFFLAGDDVIVRRRTTHETGAATAVFDIAASNDTAMAMLSQHIEESSAITIDFRVDRNDFMSQRWFIGVDEDGNVHLSASLHNARTCSQALPEPVHTDEVFGRLEPHLSQPASRADRVHVTVIRNRINRIHDSGAHPTYTLPEANFVQLFEELVGMVSSPSKKLQGELARLRSLQSNTPIV